MLRTLALLWATCMLLSGYCEAAAVIDPAAYLASQVNVPDYTVQGIWAKHKHLPNWDVIKAAAEDTWPHLPTAYEKDYRNPCWTENGQFRCLPYFQILGVSKCGTTDLYHRMTYHADFIDCGYKGPHFWDEVTYLPAHKASGRDAFGNYIKIFDRPAQQIKPNTQAITGEASSNTYTGVYAYLRGRTVVKKINATTAQYLYEATPWGRYIMLFRDPVSRYYSAFFYYRPKAMGAGTAEEFHERVVTDIGRWNKCIAESNKHDCLRKYEPQQLVKGMYAEFLPGWLEVFPRSRFLIMRTEDYKAAPKEHVFAAIKFLGMREMNGTEAAPLLRMKQRNTQSQKYSAWKMKPETKKMLQDFYRPFNQKLVEVMGGDERWLWGY